MLTLTASASAKMSVEEFAAERREAQDLGAEALLPAVVAGLAALEAGDVEWEAPIFDALTDLFAMLTERETEGELVDLTGVEADLTDAMSLTTPESNPDLIALWLANIAINEATVWSAMLDGDGFGLEWFSMEDDSVREFHREAHGQFRPVGEPFQVGPDLMPYPGYPLAPIDNWANCRCVLRVRKVDDAVTAGAYAVVDPEGEVMAEQTEVVEEVEEIPAPTLMDGDETGLVPAHGVLAPEGVMSGDGRGFRPNSLTHRDLPLPMTWQKANDEGHKGGVPTTRIERIWRDEAGLLQWDGHMLPGAESDEVTGLIAQFGKFGVSIDADSAVASFDDDSGETWFDEGRICSASIVSIPAFAEAYIALGPHPDAPVEEVEEEMEEVDPGVEVEVVEEAALDLPTLQVVAEFADVAPGKTEDGPGWITDPIPTDRLRDYWVRGPGAAKIGWGTPGDFNRCRVNVAEYVAPQHLNGYCANRHYDALGFWPGPNTHASEALELSDTDGSGVSLVASAGVGAPAEWFENPNLTEATPLTITEDGRVFGHLATFGVCHIGLSGVCTEAPRSPSGYAYFRTGGVLTDRGDTVPVGQLTLGGGHADHHKGWRAAAAHYDQTSSAWADVAVGDDNIGIWFAGRVRPGTTDEVIYAARASALSGDWREVKRGSREMELVAALSVNTPGFMTPRFGVEDGAQISLTAAGIVPQTHENVALAGEDLVDAVAERLEQRAAQRATEAALERNKKAAALKLRLELEGGQ